MPKNEKEASARLLDNRWNQYLPHPRWSDHHRGWQRGDGGVEVEKMKKRVIP